MKRAGYVLVGGRSSRMGRDKAWLTVEGGALAARVAATVIRAADRVALVGDPERHAGLGYRVVPDLYPGEGPLGGILTALADSTAEWNLIVACDMPALSAELLAELLDRAETCGAAITAAQSAGRLEPLCAVYRAEAKATLDNAFWRGVRQVRAAFEGLSVEAFPVAEVAYFQNLNTPEDWSRYAAG